MEIVLSLSTLSPLTHLCPCEDRAHSGVPRPCRRCSSTSPGSGLWAVHARSPATQRLSGSTGPAQPEPPNLKGGGGGADKEGGSFPYRRIQQWDKKEADTHPHTRSSPTPTQPCRSIWNCRVCSNSLRSGTLPAWSTHWCLRGRWGM